MHPDRSLCQWNKVKNEGSPYEGLCESLQVYIRLSCRPLTRSNGRKVQGLGVGQECIEEMSIRPGLEEGLRLSLRHQIRQYRFCSFKDPELVKKLQEARSGCVVMAMRREASVNALRDAPPAAVACWRGHTSINVLVTKVGIHIEELRK